MSMRNCFTAAMFAALFAFGLTAMTLAQPVPPKKAPAAPSIPAPAPTTPVPAPAAPPAVTPAEPAQPTPPPAAPPPASAEPETTVAQSPDTKLLEEIKGTDEAGKLANTTLESIRRGVNNVYSQTTPNTTAIIRSRMDRLHEKFNWMIYTYTPVLALILIGVITLVWRSFLPVRVRDDEEAPEQTERPGDRTTRVGPARGFGLIGLMLLIGAIALVALIPVFSAEPAKPTAKIAGINPDFVGQGRDGSDDQHPMVDLNILCTPRCAKTKVTEVKFKTSGLSVDPATLELSKDGRKVTGKLKVEKDAATGYSGFSLVREGEDELDSGGMMLKVMSDQAAFALYEARQGMKNISNRDPRVSEAFAAIAYYASPDGDTAKAAVKRMNNPKTTRQAVDEVLRAADAQTRYWVREVVDAEAAKLRLEILTANSAAAEAKAEAAAAKAEAASAKAEAATAQKRADSAYGLAAANGDTTTELAGVVRSIGSQRVVTSVRLFGRERKEMLLPVDQATKKSPVDIVMERRIARLAKLEAELKGSVAAPTTTPAAPVPAPAPKPDNDPGARFRP